MVDINEYYLHQDIWQKKPHIRLVYERWIKMISPFLPDGRLLEVGSGSGLLRDLVPTVLLSDVLPLPWLDIAADCLHLPFDDGSFNGLLAFDMLHHVSDPIVF